MIMKNTLLIILVLLHSGILQAEETLSRKMNHLLAAHCVECHRPDKKQGELDLTTREALLKGGTTGASVVAGNPKSSLLFQMVSHLEEPFMPHKSPKLSVESIELVKKWIEEGTPYEGTVQYFPKKQETHWSFTILRKPPVPESRGKEWVRTPIDAFIRSAQEIKGLTSAAPASRERLVRRVTFDLTGLPPTPQEIAAFLNDSSPDAYEKLIDRLLASPRYGERWGRHWLDLARYADSMGYRFDDNTPGAYHYRDFVIQAFNSDMPYDQFVRWQLAGDELAPQDLSARAATGFLAVGPRERDEGDALNRKTIRYNELDDILSTMSSSMLGLTMGCARCHDHKFDPISQKEYHALLVAFQQGKRVELPIESPEQTKTRMKWEEKNAGLNAQVSKWWEAQLSTLEPVIAARGAKISVIENEFRTKAGLPPKQKNDLSEVRYALYEGEWQEFPNFNELKPTRTGKMEPARLDQSPASGKSRYALVLTGKLNVPEKGAFEFILTSDDHARVYINGLKVVETDGLNGEETRKEAVQLASGSVDIRLEYVQGENGAVVRLEWDSRSMKKRSLSKIQEDTEFEQAFKKRGEELLTKPRASEYQKLNASINELKKNPALDKEAMASLPAEAINEWKALQALRDELQKQRPPETQKCQAYQDQSSKPEKGYLLKRGIVDQLGEEVPPGFLSALTAKEFKAPARPATAQSTYQRAQLAQWVTDTDHGAGRLLARVMANRLWHYHFGEGLVRTPNDFGTQGDRPALPVLLDYLAADLISNNWRLKPLHRLILLSNTYQQDTAFDETKSKIDPENRLWWRRRPVRLEAEILRDSVLFVSGVMNERMYGPGVMVPIPPELVITRTEGKGNYPKDIKDGPETWRRSAYVFLKRTVPAPIMTLFDGPDQSCSCGKREKTTVAPQALLMMNDSFMRARSQDFARRVQSLAKEPRDQIVTAFELALGRKPSESERSKALEFLEKQSSSREGDSSGALTDYCQVLFGLNEFLYVN